MREYAYGEGFTEMHTPKLMGTASESGAEVFKVGYFDRTAYLAQSPQFYKQNAFRYGCPPHGGLGMGLNRVLMVLLGLESIRDATFLFRGPNRLTP